MLHDARRRSITVLVVAGIAVGAIAISPAFGGPGFLTTHKAKKTFLTKKKAKKTFAAKADKTNTYTKAESDARFLAGSGTTKVQITPDKWVPASGLATTVFSTAAVNLSSSGAASDRFFDAGLNLPSNLLGHNVRIDSFELCYSASANATLDRVFLADNTDFVTANVFGNTTTPIDDDTDRTDAACRTYSAGSPVTIGPNDFAQVIVRVDYAVATSMTVTRLTVNLST